MKNRRESVLHRSILRESAPFKGSGGVPFYENYLAQAYHERRPARRHELHKRDTESEQRLRLAAHDTRRDGRVGNSPQQNGLP